MTKEFLIGFVFLIAAAIVAFVTATVQNFNPFKDEFVVYVDFNRVNDLSKDNDVTFNGLRIGFVKSIEFRNIGNERKIRVTLSLEQVDLPVNAIISIQDRTILGGKKINITRPDESGPRAEPGHVFIGQDPDPLLKEAGTTLKKIGESFDELKTLLTDIKEGQGTLGKLFTDPKLFNEWTSAGKEFSDVGSKLNKGDGTLGKLINEPDLYNDAKSYMDRLNRLHFDFTLDWKNFPEKSYSITEGGLRLTTDPAKFYVLKASIFSMNHETEIATPRAIAKQDNTRIYPTVLVGRRFLDAYNLELAAGLLEGEVGFRTRYGVRFDNDMVWLQCDGRSRIRDKYIREGGSVMMTRVVVEYEKRFERFPTLKITAGANNILHDTEGFIGLGFEFRDDDLKYIASALGGAS